MIPEQNDLNKDKLSVYSAITDGIRAQTDCENITYNQDYIDFCKKYHINLNEQQSQAVQATDGATLLVAVPGSGKTTVLVVRLGYMILCKHIVPENILAMTYTKAAARDMQIRFSEYFGSQLAQRVSIHTINSVSNGIIKHYCSINNRNTPTIISDSDKARIIKSIYKTVFDDYATDGDITEIETSISFIKNMMFELSEIEKHSFKVPKMTAIYKHYQIALQEQSLIDYDDQMIYARRILLEHQEILAHFQEKYRYICVDEAQDTSKLQHSLIHILSEKHNNIFMVGDEDQSIYGFRAAYPQALMDFQTDYRDPLILLLERNYRSTEEIVSLAAGFIKNNINRHQKQIISDRGHGGTAEEIQLTTRYEQYTYLLDIAKKHTTQTAVLYRDNDFAIPLIDLFIRNNVPYRLLKSKDTFFTNRVVTDIKSFIELAINPYNCEAFMQIYYKCGYGFNKKTAQWTCNRSRNERISIPDALCRQLDKWPKIKAKAEHFSKFIAALSSMTSEQAIDFIYDNDYSKYMMENQLDYNKIELLKAIARSEPNLKGFIARLAELPELIKNHTTNDDKAVILSTIHSAKGLEFDTVYLMDIYDGILPSGEPTEKYFSEDAMEQYQEDRRLIYVALTRAKNNLYLLSLNDRNTEFIDELFPEGNATIPIINQVSAGSDYTVNSRIQHISKGNGTIKEIISKARTNGTFREVQFQFDSGEHSTQDLDFLIENNMIKLI